MVRLNEGHTVFVERKIQGRMNGEPLRQLSAAEGWNDLQQGVVRILYNHFFFLFPYIL